MNDILACILTWLAGVILGMVFFAGLWWTIRKGIASPHPATWFFGSLLLRMCIAVAGFYFASAGHWQRLLICLLGFLNARLFVTWLTRSAMKSSTASIAVPDETADGRPLIAKEFSHAD